MIDDLQAGEIVVAEKIDRISRLPLAEAEKLVASIRAKGARLSVPGIIDLDELAAEAHGVPRIVLESVQDMLLKLALQMARDDYEDRRERQRQGIELAKAAGRYAGRKTDTTTHERITALRASGKSIAETARIAGCSASQVKRDRLLAHDSVRPDIKEKLRAQFKDLDPVQQLQEIRTAQQTLSEFAGHGVCAEAAPADESAIAVFLPSLSSAWKEGEARPTHRKQPKAKHWWRSRVDPFADAWPLVEGWLIAEPSVQAKVLLDRLIAMFPEAYAGKAQLRTLQRRVKAWRAERVKELIMGGLQKTADAPAEV